MKKALVIDGNSLIYRCFYATQSMLNFYHQNNLVPSNALRLVIQMMSKLLHTTTYDYVFFAFDHYKKTFRNEFFEDYKAKRQKTPDDLLVQIPWIRTVLEAMGIYCYSMEGFEADDLVGSFCKIMNQQNISVDVYTSDKDLLQLVNALTSLHLFKTGISTTQVYTFENFSQLFFDLQPSQIVDYKAIIGDGSDNYNGIKGIGPKTASNLLKKYQTINNIYQHLDELAPSQKQKFIECKKQANLCYKLATLKTHLFDNLTIDTFVKKSLNLERYKQIGQQLRINNFEKYISGSNFNQK